MYVIMLVCMHACDEMDRCWCLTDVIMCIFVTNEKVPRDDASDLLGQKLLEASIPKRNIHYMFIHVEKLLLN